MVFKEKGKVMFKSVMFVLVVLIAVPASAQCGVFGSNYGSYTPYYQSYSCGGYVVDSSCVSSISDSIAYYSDRAVVNSVVCCEPQSTAKLNPVPDAVPSQKLMEAPAAPEKMESVLPPDYYDDDPVLPQAPREEFQTISYKLATPVKKVAVASVAPTHTKLVLYVAPNASVVINGQQTKQLGTKRTYTITGLQPNKWYMCNLVIDGKYQMLAVQSGGTKTVQ